MGIGMAIKLAREKKGMSRIDFAKKMGVTPAAVGQWEREESGPLLDMYLRIREIIPIEEEYTKLEIKEKTECTN